MIHVMKQENVTHTAKKQLIETVFGRSQILDLAEKHLKAAIINMFNKMQSA